MLYVIDKMVEPARLVRRKRRGCCLLVASRNMVNEDVRPDMLQELAGIL